MGGVEVSGPVVVDSPGVRILLHEIRGVCAVGVLLPGVVDGRAGERQDGLSGDVECTGMRFERVCASQHSMNKLRIEGLLETAQVFRDA